MPFPFNFAFSVPGIANPFSPQESLRSSPTPGSPTQGTKKPKLGMNGKIFGASRAVKSDLLRRRPSTPSLELPQPTSRKRGWVPSSSEPSIPTTVPATVQTSTSSRLNSPLINQGVMQHTNDQDQQDHDEMEGDLPAPKRRKTFAGSIVSTALSAALIGTAVGLTVYRLWRGKAREIEAPPPYEQGEWTPSSDQDHDKSEGPHYVPQPNSSQFAENNNNISPSMRNRRPRHVAGRRPVPRHRKVQPRTAQPAYVHTPNFASPSQPSNMSIQPEFSFSSPDHAEDDQDPDVSDQMDWIGDRLSQLIEEGKKALGKEIVVMSETKEDEEDDGSGQWVEDSDMLMASSSSGSFRKSRSKRPRGSTVSSSPPRYASPQTTPRTPQKNRFDPYSSGRRGSVSAVSSPSRPSRNSSVDSARSFVPAKEDESAWESAELRESMEKARQLYLQRKQHLS